VRCSLRVASLVLGALAGPGSVQPGALAGWLLANGSLALPLVLAGSVKAIYDLLLLRRFQSAVLDHDRTP
jgi:hypothetical protein